MRKCISPKAGGLLGLLIAMLWSPLSLAEISLNGFATFTGGSTFSEDDTLHGYDDTLSFGENSLLGLQINADSGDKITATAQIISRGSESWEADFEWAYVGYQATDNVKFLFGRQRVPFYSYSDYLDVGYAYHWITPPETIYSLPFDSTNGIGVLINNQLGSVDSTLHLVYGRYLDTLEISGEENAADIKNQISAAWNLSWNWLAFRAGYSQADLILEIPAINGLAAAWEEAGFPEFVPHIATNDDNNTGSFLDFAITIDHNNLLFVTEYTELSIEGTPLQDKREAYYASLGYRINSVMPHITVGAAEETPSDYSFLDDVPTGISPELDALNQGTAALFEGARSESEFYQVGLRWDFHSSAAFKVEYKSEKNKLTDESVNLFRFAITTVF